MWGGGVIALVAVALWMLYLLPSWQNRHRFHAAERNAVRLNQALRVLAETSETPREVRLELTARTALAQQRLARRALAERERAALERSRVELEAARAEAAVARAHPAARRARARRRTRLTATVALVAGLGVLGLGAWRLIAAGEAVWLVPGATIVVVAGVVLQRMAAVASRAARRIASIPVAARAARTAAEVPDIAMPAAAVRNWQPRTLPAPLSSAAGSRAASVLDAAEAREALRAAALEEAKRERAARTAPAALADARAEHAAADAASASPYARMGYVNDAEIEAHVRRLLQARRAG